MLDEFAILISGLSLRLRFDDDDFDCSEVPSGQIKTFIDIIESPATDAISIYCRDDSSIRFETKKNVDDCGSLGVLRV